MYVHMHVHVHVHILLNALHLSVYMMQVIFLGSILYTTTHVHRFGL